RRSRHHAERLDGDPRIPSGQDGHARAARSLRRAAQAPAHERERVEGGLPVPRPARPGEDRVPAPAEARRARRRCQTGAACWRANLQVKRRQFVAGAGALALAGCASMKRGPEMRYRLGLSQPSESPNAIRLREMADRVAADPAGAMQIEVIPESKLGSDSAMIEMVRKGELELYLGGNVFGPLVPVTELPGLPFTFRDSNEVFVALDGELGDHIRAELAAKGLRAFRYGMDNGSHHLTTRPKPNR